MIAEGQLQCAFKERNVPNDELSTEWVSWWNCLPWEIYENLIRENLKWESDISKWTCDDSYLPYPPLMVSIRAIDEDSFAVVDITGEMGGKK